MIVRAAEADDFPKFKNFLCSDGTAHQDVVEAWIREEAASWLSPNHEMRVLVSGGDVVGVCCFEPGEEDDEWFVLLLAIRQGCQRAGNGYQFFNTCLEELAERTPGGSVYWKVDTNNRASNAMSRRVGGLRERIPADSSLNIYYVYF